MLRYWRGIGQYQMNNHVQSSQTVTSLNTVFFRVDRISSPSHEVSQGEVSSYATDVGIKHAPGFQTQYLRTSEFWVKSHQPGLIVVADVISFKLT